MTNIALQNFARGIMLFILVVGIIYALLRYRRIVLAREEEERRSRMN